MGQSANVVFESTTNAIIEAIEKGAEEWCMPWSTERFEFPSNPVTRKRYRGGNVLTLVGESLVATYSSGEWATYRQWTTVGAQVRKGERGTACIWWHVPKPVEHRDDVADAPRTGFFPRTFVVFNAAQVDDYSATPSLRNSPQQLVTADTFFANVDANVEHRNLGRAFYSPDRDLIVLPQFDSFVDTASYYATSAHEHAHWTGHPDRLNRDLTGRFGSDGYAMEELVAELSAAFTCAMLGISPTPRPDHAAYLALWLRVLRADSKALHLVAGKAQAATDYLVSFGEPVDLGSGYSEYSM